VSGSGRIVFEGSLSGDATGKQALKNLIGLDLIESFDSQRGLSSEN